MKPFKFWFHYNKPQSLQQKCNVLTVHFKNACHFVTGIDCRVPIETRNRKVQPRCVMSGTASNITIENGVAVIA